MDGMGGKNMIPKDCPINKPRKRTPRKNLEAVVVRECLLYLKQHPQVIYIERRNTGAVVLEGGGFIRFGSKGAADIWCLIQCRSLKHYPDEQMFVCQDNIDGSCAGSCHTHVEVECKRQDGKGRQSEAQKAFQEYCDSHGIPYILVTSANELAKKLSAIVLDK